MAIGFAADHATRRVFFTPCFCKQKHGTQLFLDIRYWALVIVFGVRYRFDDSLV